MGLLVAVAACKHGYVSRMRIFQDLSGRVHAEASPNAPSKTKSKSPPVRLADMPAFHNVNIAELVPHRQGLMYLLEFDQPRLPHHFRAGKAPLAQVHLEQCLQP